VSLFDQIYPEATAEQRAAHKALVADIRAHSKQRPCPEGCGCTETYDDRHPEKPTGGFGIAGCPCNRC